MDFSSFAAKDSMAMMITTVRMPSITASGTWVGAKTARNFPKDAPTPPASEGWAIASWKAVTQYVKRSPMAAARNTLILRFALHFLQTA